MGDQDLSEAALQPLALSDYAMVMAKSPANRLAFATWLMFFRDHGRFPRGPSDLESLDIAAAFARVCGPPRRTRSTTTTLFHPKRQMTIIVDSREQLPYEFEGAISKAPTADYSVVGFENQIALERKAQRFSRLCRP